jgi:hypothetical protein
MIVLDDHTCPVGMVWNLERFFSQESCGWCTPCLFTFRSQGKQYFAGVFTPAMPADVAAGREAVYQLNRTVMSNLQPLGQLSDSWTNLCGQPFQDKHELMLARLKTSYAGSLLTEVQKTADLITQLRQ